MKRSWLGFILLMALLLGCVLVTVAMERIHDPIETELLQAAQCAMEENWTKAHDLFRKARGNWEETEHFRTCFADHTPVEEIDADFEMLTVLGAARDAAAFAGGCRSLARQVAAVGESHELVWWNLL